MKKRYVVLGLALVVFLACAPAQAAILNTYTDEAVFLAAHPGLPMESFEAYGDGTQLPLNVGAFTVSTNNVSHGSFNSVTSLMASEGIMSVRYGADAGDSMFFTFSTPVSVFGLYIMDFGSTSMNSLLTYQDNSGNSQVALSGMYPTFLKFFYGVELSSPATQFEFKFTGGFGDGIYFDSVYYGTSQVPIPAAAWLLGSGLLGLLGLRRKLVK